MGHRPGRDARLIGEPALVDAPRWLWAAGGFASGTIIGSYLATIVVRWPRGEAARGRSRCDGCGRTLAARDLVPLLSCLIARGRCRACGVRIDPTHPVMEAAAGMIGLVALHVAPGAAGLAGAAFGWLLLALGLLDLRHFWLPDRLTAALALAGLAAGLARLPPPLIDRLAGGAAGYGALAVIAAGYRAARGRAGMGAGDPKLFGAIGLWLGWRALPVVLLFASLIGLAAVLVMRMRGGAVRATLRLPLGALLALAAWPCWLALTMEWPPA